jgi:hypothetical protein
VFVARRSRHSAWFGSMSATAATRTASRSQCTFVRQAEGWDGTTPNGTRRPPPPSVVHPRIRAHDRFADPNVPHSAHLDLVSLSITTANYLVEVR